MALDIFDEVATAPAAGRDVFDEIEIEGGSGGARDIFDEVTTTPDFEAAAQGVDAALQVTGQAQRAWGLGQRAMEAQQAERDPRQIAPWMFPAEPSSLEPSPSPAVLSPNYGRAPAASPREQVLRARAERGPELNPSQGNEQITEPEAPDIFDRLLTETAVAPIGLGKFTRGEAGEVVPPGVQFTPSNIEDAENRGLTLPTQVSAAIGLLPEGALKQLGAGGYNAVAGLVNFFLSPQGAGAAALGGAGPASLRTQLILEPAQLGTWRAQAMRTLVEQATPAAKRGMSAGFAYSMATSAPEQLEAGDQAYRNGDLAGAVEGWLGGLGSIGLAALAGSHATFGRVSPIAKADQWQSGKEPLPPGVRPVRESPQSQAPKSPQTSPTLLGAENTPGAAVATPTAPGASPTALEELLAQQRADAAAAQAPAQTPNTKAQTPTPPDTTPATKEDLAKLADFIQNGGNNPFAPSAKAADTAKPAPTITGSNVQTGTEMPVPPAKAGAANPLLPPVTGPQTVKQPVTPSVVPGGGVVSAATMTVVGSKFNPKAKGRGSPFYVRPRSDGVPDILDAIQEAGGIAPLDPAQFGPNWRDAFAGPARMLIRAGGRSIDKLVDDLNNKHGGNQQTFRVASADDILDEIRRASGARQALQERGGGPEAQQARFWDAATAPKSTSGLVKVSADQLKVGDVFRLRAPGVSHEELTVTHISPDDGTVTVKDGRSFGEQDMPEGTEIWVQKKHHTIDIPGAERKTGVDANAPAHPAGDNTGEQSAAKRGTGGTVPLSARDPRAIGAGRRLERAIRAKFGVAGAKVTLVHPNGIERGVPRRSSAVGNLQSLANVFGKSVVWFRVEGIDPQQVLRGWSDPQDDLILINADFPQTALGTAAHELMHQFKRDNPLLYGELKAALLKLSRMKGSKYEAAKLKYGYTAGQLPDELVADFAAHAFHDPTFLKDLAKENPGVFKRVMNRLIALLDRLLAKLTKSAQAAGELFADLQAARDRLKQALHDWADWHQNAERIRAEEAKGKTFQASNAKITGPGMVEIGGPGGDFSITAHHGTPHKVDKFTTAKIGTGEGAQVYGWGLYFAENPAVAENYAQTLSDRYRDQKAKEGETRLNEQAEREGLAVSWSDDRGRFYLRPQMAPGESATYDPAEIEAKASETLRAAIAQANSSVYGNKYTVELNAEPEDLLDWDKPLSEQSERVKAAMEPLLQQADSGYRAAYGKQWLSKTPSAIYFGLSEESPKAASQRLSKAGIKGIRFLDQGSRTLPDASHVKRRLEIAQSKLEKWKDPDVARFHTPELIRTMQDQLQSEINSHSKVLFEIRNAPKPTYNYVIFDENDITITHENGRALTPEQAFSMEREDGFNFDAPESVMEQKARLQREAKAKADAEKLAEKKALVARGGDKLTGADVDTTAEMFGGVEGRTTRQDKAGQGSLFSVEHADPAPYAELQAKVRDASDKLAEAIKQHGNVALRPAGMSNGDALKAKHAATAEHRAAREALLNHPEYIRDLLNQSKELAQAARAAEEAGNRDQALELHRQFEDTLAEIEQAPKKLVDKISQEMMAQRPARGLPEFTPGTARATPAGEEVAPDTFMERRKKALAQLPAQAREWFNNARKFKEHLGARIAASSNKELMAADFDSGETLAMQFGKQAANLVLHELNRAFGATADRVGARNPTREAALTFFIESGGTMEGLADAREQILGSQHNRSKWADEALRAIKYAETHFNRLAPVAQLYAALTDNQVLTENEAGVSTIHREGGYVFHLQDIMSRWAHGELLAGSSSGGPGAPFKHIREHPTYAQALASGVNPRTLNAVDLLQKRLTMGNKLVNARAWIQGMRRMIDPATQTPIVTDTITKTKRNGETDVTAPPGYKVVQYAGHSVAIHSGYEGVFDALTADSKITKRALGALTMNVAATTKHLTLLIDTYHLGRMAFWAAMVRGASESGPGMFLPGAGWKYQKGLTLLDNTKADIEEAARRGEIPAAWAKDLTEQKRRLDLLIRSNLHVGTTADNIFDQSILHNLPVFSHFNHFLFQKFVRGAMSEAALIEFARQKKMNPGVPEDQLARQVAKDLNIRFGNLKNSSWIKGRTFQDLSRMLFLAPQWNESLIRSELGAVKDILQAPGKSIKSRRINIGPLGRAVFGALFGTFLINQIINWITRGKPTWENEEEGEAAKLSAWIPDVVGDSPGYFLNPMTLPAEISELLAKKTERSGDFTKALHEYVAGRSSLPGRAGLTFLTRKDWTGAALRDGREVAGEMISNLIPLPMSSEAIVGVAKQAWTGQPSEQYPGQFQRQMFQTVGIKLDSAPSADQRMRMLATRFNRAAGVKPSAEFFHGDYYDLDRALRIGNPTDMKLALAWVLEKKTPDDIKKHYNRWATAPFTGKLEREADFKKTLNTEQMAVYYQAKEKRKELANTVKALLQKATP